MKKLDAEKKRKHDLDVAVAVANGTRCANEWHHLYSMILVQKRLLDKPTLDDILTRSPHSDVMTELHKHILSEPKNEMELNSHIKHMARMATMAMDDGLKLEHASFKHFCDNMVFRHYSPKILSLCGSPLSLSAVRLGGLMSSKPCHGLALSDEPCKPPPDCIMDNCSFFIALSTIPPSEMDYHGDDLCGENIESFLTSLTVDIAIAYTYDAHDRISRLQRMLTQLNRCINLRRFSLTIHYYLMYENKKEFNKLPPEVQQLLTYYFSNDVVRRSAGDSTQSFKNHQKTIEAYAQCRQLIAMMMDPCASMPIIKRLESKSHDEKKHVLMVAFKDEEIPLNDFIWRFKPRAHCLSSRVPHAQGESSLQVRQHASPRRPSGWDVVSQKKGGSTKKRCSKRSNTKKLRHKHKY